MKTEFLASPKRQDGGLKPLRKTQRFFLHLTYVYFQQECTCVHLDLFDHALQLSFSNLACKNCAPVGVQTVKTIQYTIHI